MSLETLAPYNEGLFVLLSSYISNLALRLYAHLEA